MSFDLLEKGKQTGEIREIPAGPWIEECTKRGIELNDVGDRWSEADLLIGNDYWGAVRTGRLVHLDCGLTAEETIFGWTIGGPVPAQNIIASVMSLEEVPPQTIERLWSLETLGIRDPVENLTRVEEEETAMKHFKETVIKCPDGSYVVALPWRAPSNDVPSNRQIAEIRLKSTTYNLQKSGKLSQYHAVFKSWEDEGLITKVDNMDSGHFIPHRPVFKESETTPVRPVFDASCRQGRQPSLNDCLYKGPNLIELIPTMLLRFGKEKIGVTADIRKAFQMLKIRESDKKYQRFLWWENEDCETMITYEHERVVFGVTSSPFLLGATIKHHLDGLDSPTAAVLRRSFYVDNLVTSVPTIEDYEKLKVEASKIMGSAKMELRQWAYSLSESSPEDSHVEQKIQPLLGLAWNVEEDWLSCVIRKTTVEGTMTKRIMLSLVAQIFDPMGYLAPALLIPKMIVQAAWGQNCGWDDPVPTEIEQKFAQWRSQLELLTGVKIRRWSKIETPDVRLTEVHIFCDSSVAGMSAVGFLKTVDKEGSCKLQFLFCKSRLTPMKKTSIPRLELTSCVLGVRVAMMIADALDMNVKDFIFWSDSFTALAWIRRSGDWGVYVRNRVKEILSVTKSEQWCHVPGMANPADLPSRGCNPKALVRSAWWEGPTRLEDCGWSAYEETEDVNEAEVLAEMRKTGHVMLQQELEYAALRFSSYRRNVAVWGWVLRFVKNCREKRVNDKRIRENDNDDRVPYLSVNELRLAEKQFIRQIQKEAFPENCREIGGIDVIRDEEGLIRAKSRLVNREDLRDFIYPIVLPKKHPAVDLLVADAHQWYGHGGVQFLQSKLREKYWIIQSRRLIRRVLRRCVKCRRHAAKPMEVDPAPLPSRRVQATEVFQTTGIDLAGPLYLKDRTKVWIVVFTCAVFRAVYLDIVTSLSTEDFVLALERFVSLNARPNTIYTDNGTNFVGTANLLKRVDWEKVQEVTNAKQIQWIFNPPTAAWWGGWWERIVRMVKDLLKRILGRARLSYDEMRKCLCGVAATINDRPLTVVTEDAMDLVPLTPAMFVRPRADFHFPELGTIDGMRRCYRKMKDIQKALEERFRKEYLGLLVTRCGKGRQSKIEVGDVVLVGTDNRKRYEWPLGVVVELLPGKDEKTRVVIVKTSSGILKRPLQRLFPLEISSSEEKSKEEIVEAPVNEEVIKTRAGRIVKKPVRYGQWMHLIVDV